MDPNFELLQKHESFKAKRFQGLSFEFTESLLSSSYEVCKQRKQIF